MHAVAEQGKGKGNWFAIYEERKEPQTSNNVVGCGRRQQRNKRRSCKPGTMMVCDGEGRIETREESAEDALLLHIRLPPWTMREGVTDVFQPLLPTCRL